MCIRIRMQARNAPVMTGENMEMGFVARFERQVLFRIARFVAFSICFLLFVAMIGGAVYAVAYGPERAERPDAANVAQSLKPLAEVPSDGQPAAQGSLGPATLSSDSVLRGVRIPPSLQEMMLDADNQQIFHNWLSAIPDEERQAFIDGAAKAVEEARRIAVNDAQAINNYHQQFDAYITKKAMSEAAAKQMRMYAAGFVLATLMLLAMFSLVLVLLAIERNTRLQPSGAAA